MTTQKLTLRIATLALVAATASVALFAGCSGDDSNTGPSQVDSGSDVSEKMDAKPGKDTGADSKMEKDATPPQKDGASLETGTCKSDSSTCNSCYDDAQAAQDPYNSCSPFTKNCVKFTTAVPTHPTL